MIPIKNITIYSESDFVPKILGQIYKDSLLNCASYDSFARASLFAEESIVIVDVNKQMVFDKLISPYLSFYEVYPLILLVPNSLALPDGSYASLSKPLQHLDLCKKINSLAINHIQRLSQDMFLNHKTLNLIRTSKEGKAETRLTDIEFKILKYLLERKVATEEAILNDVLGYSNASQTNTFKVHMHRLKCKLSPGFIERKGGGKLGIAEWSAISQAPCQVR